MATRTETKPETPSALRDSAERDERPVEDVGGRKVRPDVMAHFRAGVERNRKLLELLAQRDTNTPINRKGEQ